MPSALVSSKLRLIFIAFLALVTLVLTLTLVTGGASAAEPVSVLVSPIAPDCGPDWSVVSSPSVGTGANHLYGVAAVSSDDVWAVGGYRDSSNVDHTLTIHWNG